MSTSLKSWSQVWSNASTDGEYSFIKGRCERALDKLDHIRSLGVQFKEDEKVLEAGCGDGAVIIALQKQFQVQGFGADFAASAKNQADKLMQSEDRQFHFVLADICDLPFADNYFDKIISLGVVEHMDDPRIPLRELCRVLKPGGIAVIMTPSSLSFGRLDRILKQLCGAWSMGFQDEFAPGTLARLLREAGFKCVNKRAVHRPALHFDSINRRLVSYFDSGVRAVFKSWGFYSYTWATKE